MFNFWNNKKPNSIDVNTLTAQSFESFIQRLSNIPESNWGQGRREPVLELIEKFEQIHPKLVKFVRPEIGNNKFYTIIKIEIGAETYIYFEELTMNCSQPIINWFQLEKQDKSWGQEVYRTKLLLSSDDKAISQGSTMFLLFNSMV